MRAVRFSSPTRHSFLAASVAALSVGLFVFAASSYAQSATTGDTKIRPFKVQVPQAALDDLRRRIAATRSVAGRATRQTAASHAGQLSAKA